MKLNIILLETAVYCIWAQKGRRNGYQAHVRLPTKGEVQRLGYTGPGQVLKSGGGSGALNKGTSFCICTLLIGFVCSGVRKATPGSESNPNSRKSILLHLKI